MPDATAPSTPEKPEGAKDPETGTRYSDEEIHEHILTDADEEMERPVFELAYSGLAAGLGIGFSMLASALLTSRMSPANAPIAKAITYPLGFIFVVLSRHQLFTENTLEPVIPLLERHNGEALRRVLRLWSIVLPANLLGAALFGLVIAKTNALDPNLDAPLRELARHATEGGALLVFYRAIWAGWLVALMAWLLASTRETLAQMALIWLTTAPIAAFGFRHSIAGAAEAFYRVWIGDFGFGQMLTSYELPALAGNIVGGVVLVALVNHGQVGSKAKKKTEEAATAP